MLCSHHNNNASALVSSDFQTEDEKFENSCYLKRHVSVVLEVTSSKRSTTERIKFGKHAKIVFTKRKDNSGADYSSAKKFGQAPNQTLLQLWTSAMQNRPPEI